MKISFRVGTKEDVPALAELFRRTVVQVNGRDYSPEQIAAWVGCATPARWDILFSGDLQFILAEVEFSGALLGFAAVNVAGYLHSLFVHADYQRRGIGQGLLEHSETYARMKCAPEMTSEVSLTARPFFECNGYRVLREQQVERGGVVLTNFAMVKPLL